MSQRHVKGLIRQIYIIAAIVLLITMGLTYYAQYRLSYATVAEQTEELAVNTAEEVMDSIREYPAYDWLLHYWIEHAGELDIEYDADYETGEKTREQSRLLLEHQPGMFLKYATAEEVEALPEEDQKLYAEIVYSWLLTRVDQIKRNYKIDYLFSVVTDTASEDAYQKQFFLFSGAEPGAVRGTGSEDAYVLGVEVSVADNKSQQDSMRSAVEKSREKLANAGDYVDCYVCMEQFDDKAVLIGVTYNMSSLKKIVRIETWRGTFYGLLFETILLALIILFLVRYVLHPLGGVQKNIRLYKKTKDSATVIDNIRKILEGQKAIAVRNNEIGELSEDVISLAQEVDDYILQIETITAKEERIGTELALAAQIQTSMLPNRFPAFPERKEFDIYAIMDPAKEVGGDFYDFFLIDEDHLGLVIADVSGKGIPAALFMMVSKIILQSCAQLGQSAGEILNKTNEALCSENQTGMFVTVWVGILEISTGKLTAANAGHEYPYLMRNGRFELFKDKHGFVIGGMEGTVYREYEIQMEPGDALFVYTDGVPEANDEERNLFGMDRLTEALNRNPEADCRTQIQNVRQAVSGFVKDSDQFDDLTMLCLKYYGPQPFQG
ncbi:MAG: serine/threonine-protein phosphatase [Firmicutes bacterium]|nr:serine/threonine-protein phosphatase [Bacillota bacterium]